MNKINIIKEEDIEHDVVVDIPFEVNTCGIYVCKRIDRTEALQKSIEILEKAEQERIAVAEYEAEIRKEYEPIKYLQELIEKKKKDFEEEMQTLHWILNCMEDEYQRKIAMLKGGGEV